MVGTTSLYQVGIKKERILSEFCVLAGLGLAKVIGLLHACLYVAHSEVRHAYVHCTRAEVSRVRRICHTADVVPARTISANENGIRRRVWYREPDPAMEPYRPSHRPLLGDDKTAA